MNTSNDSDSRAFFDTKNVHVWPVVLKLLEVKNFQFKLNASREGPEKSTETRKGWKKTILLQKSGGKKRLEDYSTSVAKIKSGNRSTPGFPKAR